MTTIISITAEEIVKIDNNFYNYSGEDRILKNKISGDYEVFYSGQNQGRGDKALTDAVNALDKFNVYRREGKNLSFTFLGSTNYSSIVKERTIAKGINSLPNERLQIRLVIPLANISETQIDTMFEGVGKYKKAILQHSGFDIDVNINLGFYRNL